MALLNTFYHPGAGYAHPGISTTVLVLLVFVLGMNLVATVICLRCGRWGAPAMRRGKVDKIVIENLSVRYSDGTESLKNIIENRNNPLQL